MINVVGLGYIGLPTALMMAAHGNAVQAVGAIARHSGARIHPRQRKGIGHGSEEAANGAY